MAQPVSPALHPTIFVIFGGTGDLARSKLFPALLDLYVAGRLPQHFFILGLSRKEFTDEEYQQFVADSIQDKGHQHSSETVQEFCGRIRYVVGSFDDADSYERIKETLQTLDDTLGQCTNKLFYLAVPPQYYEVIFERLHASEAMALCDGVDSWSRLLVEKPFGRDLQTARALEERLCALFQDEQIYRIDHYLAKDAIENIIALRFVNTVLADSWYGEAIESIHIKLLETKDVSNRGSFYDSIGTLRDVGQNHLLQILALMTMPEVDVHDPASVRAARAKALRNVAASHPNQIIRGQYDGYASVEGVADRSDTETYFKIEFSIDEQQWAGTSFILEAGKAMDRKINEAVVTFRSNGDCSCDHEPGVHQHKNVLRIQFAPQVRTCLSMWTKTPGFTFELREQELVLDEHEGTAVASPEAYEQVLFDCITGDQTRFVSGAEVELAWQFITPILEKFAELPLHDYAPGSLGPVANKE